MKKLLLIAVLLFPALFSNGEGGDKAITLTSKNVKLKAGAIHEHSASISNVNLPASGTNKSWDYSGLSGGSAIDHGYIKSKSSDFSKSAVVDTGRLFLFDSDPIDDYPGAIVYDEDSKGLFMAGHSMQDINKPEPAPAPAGDAVFIPKQNDLPTSRIDVIKFPATNNSSWSSNSSQTLNWTLTLQELGWTDIKCTEVAYTSVSDKVVGWGDVKIPAEKKKDKNDFGALMVKHSVYTYDSLFVGVIDNDYILQAYFGLQGWALGYPTTQRMVDQYSALYGSDFVVGLQYAFGSAIDPYGLFASNGVSQGMVTENDNSEIFYSADDFRPVITFDFGTDNTYSSLAGIVYNSGLCHGCDGESVQVVDHFMNNSNESNSAALTTNSGLTNIAQLSVYPNPLANSSALNCTMIKNSDAIWTLNVMNMTGQVVKTMPISAHGNLNIPVQINGNLRSGLYLINTIDENGRQVGNTKLNVIGSAF